MKTSPLQSVIQACLPGASWLQISTNSRMHYQFGPVEHRVIMNEVVNRFVRNTPSRTMLLFYALQDLSSHCNKSDGGTHPSDKNRIKDAFQRLHKAGVILEKAEVECWLEYIGWPNKHAKRISKIAQEIGKGMKPVIKHGPHYPDNIIQEWMDKH